MSVPLKSVDVITLFVEDLPGSKSFYQDVLGLPMIFEDGNSAVFKFENTTVNLLKVPAAHRLIEPAAVASREAGSRFQFTIHVDDVDAACTQLAQRGVTLLTGPVNRPWGVRTASFTDPAGHIWEIAQELPQARLCHDQHDPISGGTHATASTGQGNPGASLILEQPACSRARDTGGSSG
jgi:catechol 2,3-dioxygenase-like lactoylglutathione lyase family enzyme